MFLVARWSWKNVLRENVSRLGPAFGADDKSWPPRINPNHRPQFLAARQHNRFARGLGTFGFAAQLKQNSLAKIPKSIATQISISYGPRWSRKVGPVCLLLLFSQWATWNVSSIGALSRAIARRSVQAPRTPKASLAAQRSWRCLRGFLFHSTFSSRRGFSLRSVVFQLRTTQDARSSHSAIGGAHQLCVNIFKSREKYSLLLLNGYGKRKKKEKSNSRGGCVFVLTYLIKADTFFAFIFIERMCCYFTWGWRKEEEPLASERT